MEHLDNIMGAIGTGIDAFGVLVVLVGSFLATVRFLSRRRQTSPNSFVLYRQEVGRAILLGLEFLVAGDIIRTVVVAPTMENVVVLGLIVLIRTFLSIALQLEVEGRWPWQRSPESKTG